MPKGSHIRKWVDAASITALTIWDNNEKLRQARVKGLLEYRVESRTKKSNGNVQTTYRYNLDSIHPVFFVKKEETNTAAA